MMEKLLLMIAGIGLFIAGMEVGRTSVASGQKRMLLLSILLGPTGFFGGIFGYLRFKNSDFSADKIQFFRTRALFAAVISCLALSYRANVIAEEASDQAEEAVDASNQAQSDADTAKTTAEEAKGAIDDLEAEIRYR